MAKLLAFVKIPSFFTLSHAKVVEEMIYYIAYLSRIPGVRKFQPQNLFMGLHKGRQYGIFIKCGELL